MQIIIEDNAVKEEVLDPDNLECDEENVDSKDSFYKQLDHEQSTEDTNFVDATALLTNSDMPQENLPGSSGYQQVSLRYFLCV